MRTPEAHRSDPGQVTYTSSDEDSYVATDIPLELALADQEEIFSHGILPRIRPGCELMDQVDLVAVRAITRCCLVVVAGDVALQFVVVDAVSDEQPVVVVVRRRRGRRRATAWFRSQRRSTTPESSKGLRDADRLDQERLQQRRRRGSLP